MASKKYLNDYRVHEQIDSRGRTRSEVVYIGGDFAILPPVPEKTRRRFFIFALLLWLCFFGALIFPARATYLTYVLLPFVFSALPMYFLTGSAFAFFRAEEPLTRRVAERIASRLPVGAVLTAVLCGIAFIVLCVNAVISFDTMLLGDALFGALSLFMTLAAAYIYKKSRNIKAQLIENGSADKLGHSTANVPKNIEEEKQK